MLRWSPYVLAKFGEVWSTHPWESSVSSDPHPKIAREHALHRRYISAVDYPISLKFCIEFTAWHPKCCRSSRSKGGRSKSHRDITYSKIINNLAGDCSISLKVLTYFDHVTLDVSQTFKVNRSKVKITYVST